MKAQRREAQPELRTPEQARQWLRDHGITVAAFARQNKLSRDAVNDALRGVGKGNSGKSHDAAVALGMKRDPNSCTDSLTVPHAPAMRGMSKTAGARKSA